MNWIPSADWHKGCLHSPSIEGPVPGHHCFVRRDSLIDGELPKEPLEVCSGGGLTDVRSPIWMHHHHIVGNQPHEPVHVARF